ncbi:alcohol dehydrogenase [Puteibacter caeruleilacunae]|nr:alcohol dehydrogenase [Puteibacter caeruleilacunae]
MSLLTKQKSGKAMVFTEVGKPLLSKSYPLPELSEGEVLVRNMCATICGSDLHTITGKRQEKTPTILGHEIVGRIVKLPEGNEISDHFGNKLKIGDKITWSVMAFCGRCENCKKGIPQKCDFLKKYGHERVDSQRVFSGGFAEYTHLWKGTAIFKLSEDVAVTEQVWLNCAFATTMAAISRTNGLTNKKILVVGAGALGVLAIPVSREQGSDSVTVVDPNKDRRELAKSFGADYIFSPEEFFAQESGDYDVILEMSGNYNALIDGINRLSIGGVFVFVGSVFPMRDIGINPEQVVRRLHTFTGIHNYTPNDLAQAVLFLEKYCTKYPFDLISSPKSFGLDKCNEAFQFALETNACRVRIEM